MLSQGSVNRDYRAADFNVTIITFNHKRWREVAQNLIQYFYLIVKLNQTTAKERLKQYCVYNVSTLILKQKLKVFTHFKTRRVSLTSEVMWSNSFELWWWYFIHRRLACFLRLVFFCVAFKFFHLWVIRWCNKPLPNK